MAMKGLNKKGRRHEVERGQCVWQDEATKDCG